MNVSSDREEYSLTYAATESKSTVFPGKSKFKAYFKEGRMRARTCVFACLCVTVFVCTNKLFCIHISCLCCVCQAGVFSYTPLQTLFQWTVLQLK